MIIMITRFLLKVFLLPLRVLSPPSSVDPGTALNRGRYEQLRSLQSEFPSHTKCV